MKLAVAVVVPVAVVVLGLVLGLPITRAARRIDEAQWTSQKLIELRLRLYEDMAGPLNDLLCFFRLVGDFQAITPPVALNRKRTLDKAFYVHEHMMSEEFGRRYHAFIHACFLMYTGAGKPARLRASLTRQRAERSGWPDAWDDLLIPETITPTGLAELNEHYAALMVAFRDEVGGHVPPSAHTHP